MTRDGSSAAVILNLDFKKRITVPVSGFLTDVELPLMMMTMGEEEEEDFVGCYFVFCFFLLNDVNRSIFFFQAWL